MKSLILILSLIGLRASAQSYTELLAVHREDYKADFLADKHSPLTEDDLPNLHFFEADSTFSVTADFEVLPGEATFQMPTFSGTTRTYVRFARVKFSLKDKPYELTIYRSIALMLSPELANYMFLPFTDDTNSAETYGGGRYIDLRTTDVKNGKIEIDFNKAYNPYCAYSDGYQCPVPPRENYLPLKVTVGEMQYTGEKKHR